MKRRDFLKLGGAGLVTSTGLISGIGPTAAASTTVALTITSRDVETITGEKVKMLAFARTGSSSAPPVPGPVIRVTEGDTVTIKIKNTRPEPHGFEIGGVAKLTSPILNNQTGELTFTAPSAGTYLYHDSSHHHLYRVLGLHGALIVHPRPGTGVTANGSLTPYSLNLQANALAVSKVSMVFDAMGTIPRFAGGKWVPCPLENDFSNQEKIWLFNEIDPRFNALIKPTGIAPSALTLDAAAMVATFVPRYFTLNGRSGFDLTEGEDVVVKNYIGEPTLLRTLNAGLCHHATHIHGNHVLELAHSILTNDGIVPTMGGANGAPGQVVLHDNIWERDVWPTWPMQIRDVLLPLEVPPDIPNWQKYVDGADETFPLRYVMHDHCEMGTTAAGGNYPQGCVTHWEIRGPAGGRTV